MAKDYSQMNKEELLKEIQKLESRKTYGLVWEDKPEDVVEQCKTKVPILTEDEKKVVEKDIDKPTNILIEGDNYHALAVLNYTHRHTMDLIYIDPPYNTGAKDWKYNNDYVDREDSFRHSKWLSMMNNRLRLAKNLLARDGSLVVAIDDYEVSTLGLLLTELFPNHTQDLIIIEHHPQGAGSNTVSRTHEYAYIMTPNGMGIPNRPIRHEEQTWSLQRSGQGENNWRENRPNQFYAILINEKIREVMGVDDVLTKDEKYSLENTKDGLKRIYPIDRSGKERVWRYGRETMQKLIEKGVIEYTERGSMVIHKDVVAATPVPSIWQGSRYNAGTHGSSLLTKMFGDSNRFPYPKSLFNTLDLVRLFVGHKKDAVILDYFAGSGTTGHAVLELNKEDDGNRKFILSTNNENKIAEDATYPRIKKVIDGYSDVEGVSANLRYYKTEFVDVESVHNVSDQKKVELTYQAGRMIALREDTLEETEKNNWWQIFTDKKGKTTAIYFKEDKEKLDELINKISKSESSALYIFSWGKNEYKNEYTEYKNIRVEDIPEPILEVYKEINKK